MHDLTDGEYRALSYVSRKVGPANLSDPYWRKNSAYRDILERKGLVQYHEAADTITLTEAGRKAIGR